MRELGPCIYIYTYIYIYIYILNPLRDYILSGVIPFKGLYKVPRSPYSLLANSKLRFEFCRVVGLRENRV